MRLNHHITSLFNAGTPAIGANRPNGVVTVTPDFFLRTANVAGRYFPGSEQHVSRRNPVRWWQDRANSLEQVALPNVTKIHRSHQIGQDAASCEITLVNTKPKANMDLPSAASVHNGTLGDPGYYTFNRGDSPPARDRWKFRTNEWHRVLEPGALLRSWEGYGGHGLTLAECIAGGYLMQTGAWIVDEVDESSDGTMTLKCRDMMALMIDQLVYPPLMPDACYPTQFFNYGGTNWNYKDISSIVILLGLWAGFWLKDNKKRPNVYGNIEQTGFTPTDPIGADFFDKRTLMDCINELKQYVGYDCWVDQEGGLHFESRNIWNKGNFLYTGQHVDSYYTLDEKKNLFNYGVSTSKMSDRSDIYIASNDPQLDIPGLKFIRHNWPAGLPGEVGGTYLRGMSVPMLASVRYDMPLNEMNIMGQLIHLYLWFARRKGSASIYPHPGIDIGDQVRIWDATTSEAFYHYVRGIDSEHDLEKGTWNMTLTTNWLGASSNWAIVASDDWNIVYSGSDSQMKVSPTAFGAFRGNKIINRGT